MANDKPMNPFQYDSAITFAPDELIEYFVEDYNYSRFIQSGRNIFLIGDRGCGKSMTLLYNSYQKQYHKAKKEGRKFDYSKIGVYIPCSNSLFFKKEYELVNNEFKAAVISEHFFVLAIAYELAVVLASVINVDIAEEQRIREDISFILNIDLPEKRGHVFQVLADYIQKLISETQNQVNNSEDSISNKCVSFYSLIIPLVRIIKRIPIFSNTHFLFLIDDAHDLNIHQVKALNSWIAYRDHSDFSFKVAIAKVRKYAYATANGSSILEGHDFLTMDMEKPFQNRSSDFGLWAKNVVEKRLEKLNLGKITAEEFFPINKIVAENLKRCETIVREKAEQLYANDKSKNKKISDYVYKYTRAEYFKTRKDTANLPQYSGWETIVHMSTGVVRNLLYPCFWMYDKELSLSDGKHRIVKSISPKNQDAVIQEKSQELWNSIDSDLFNNIPNCSSIQAEHVKNLFERLVELFRDRLYSDVSEPRAVTFTISAKQNLNEEDSNALYELLRIAKEAQILYDRVSSAKEEGEREIYYVPNRRLFPVRGLDVVGQHARVSIKAVELYAAATKNKKINIKDIKDTEQNTLFDYEY